jgi:MoxR-like ATPase
VKPKSSSSIYQHRLDSLDRRDGRVYLVPADIALAVRVALAAGRPLLLRGKPGSGKSSLAAYIARERNWRYYEHVVTSRTQARDLLWTFDSVRRLGDAQSRLHSDMRPLSAADYVEPGVLWWAFAPESARRRGAPPSEPSVEAIEPNGDVNRHRSRDCAVVLIDEIDKAEPDMPNGLLVPLGSSEFVVTETNQLIRKSAPSGEVDNETSRHLIVITTNEERELPQAFLRRCVIAWLSHPDTERLIQIGEAHLNEYDGGCDDRDRELLRGLAEKLAAERIALRNKNIREPSTAEFLDALRACRNLGISVGDEDWETLCSLTLVKPQHIDDAR